jgi:hypothetical protein
MRIPEAGPFGETFLRLVSERLGGAFVEEAFIRWVESVVTFADHFFGVAFFDVFFAAFFVAISASSSFFRSEMRMLEGRC